MFSQRNHQPVPVPGSSGLFCYHKLPPLLSADFSAGAGDPSQSHLLKDPDTPITTAPRPVSSFLPCLLAHCHQETKHKTKNPSFAPSQCPVTALFPSFPLRPNSSKDLSIINVSTFHLPFSLESILSRIQPQQNSATAFLKASSDLVVISKGQFSVFLLDLSAALNMADHCLLLELSLRGLCSMNILKRAQASKSGRYKHKFWIFYTVVIWLQPNY